MIRKGYGYLSILLCSAIFLTACAPSSSEEKVNTEISAADTGEMEFEFDEKDLSGAYDESDIIEITGIADTADSESNTQGAITTATQEAAAEVSQKELSELSGTTITQAGTYRLTGSITDKVITVEAGDKDDVTLVLDNVTIANSNGPAIYIRSADKVYITVKDGTTNSISDGSSYNVTDGDTTVDAAIFSKADLTINGSGALSVDGNYKHGIVSKDDLIITAGDLTINAEKVGLNGKDCVKISSGTFLITAGSDGIRSDNDEDASRGYIYIDGGTLDITAANDGIQAQTVIKADNASLTIKSGGGSGQSLSSSEESCKGLKAGSDILIYGGKYSIDSRDDCIHSNNTITITDGTFTLCSGDDGIHADADLSISGGDINITKSYEGIESSRILISGGNIYVVASDDGFNAAGGNDGSAMGGRFGQGSFNSSSGQISISGGYIVIDASGDGIDSNGSLEITGGITLVSGPTNNGNGALDYAGTANVTDGIVIALGSSGMAQSLSSSEGQGVLAYSFSAQKGGTSFLVSDNSGNAIVSFTPSKAYECAIVTAPALENGSDYTIVVGATVSDADENGFAQGAAFTGGTQLSCDPISSGGFGRHDNMGGGNMGGGNMGGRGGKDKW